MNFVMARATEKIVCHNCLGPMTFKTGVKVERNNFGIPHFVRKSSLYVGGPKMDMQTKVNWGGTGF